MKTVYGCLTAVALAATVALLCLCQSGCVTGQVKYTDPKSGLEATVVFTPDSGK